MKNTLADLNNYLFETLERLSDDEATKDRAELDREIKRAGAVCDVAQQIISNGELAVKAANTKYNSMSADYKSPAFLLGENDG